MIRAAVSLLALAAAAPALAVEGGQVRSGEQPGFSRVVMTVEPTTEWSLETGDGRATIFFPGKALDFDTSGVFELIPRTRIEDIRSTIGPAGTTVEVTVGCDCRISTSFVAANYLALDVSDRDAEAAGLPPALPETAEPAPETPGARMARETALVASAEDMLIRQIERAADQGLIQLKDAAPRPTEDETREPERTAAAILDAPDAAGAVAPAGTPAASEAQPDAAAGPEAPPVAEVLPPAPPVAPAAAAAPEMPEQVAADLPKSDPLRLQFDHAQITATTVFERDGRAVRGRMTDVAVPTVCRDDGLLDVGSWTNGLPLHRQVPPLSRRVVGEFDRPDVQALGDLARLYIRFGFGVEAESLLRSFDVEVPERSLLIDLARAVEGRPVIAPDSLALDAACPGRHGLWLAIGGGAPAYRDAAQFEAVQGAFAELPPDLRALVGPSLVARLLDAGRPNEARIVLDIVERPGGAGSAALRLAAARVEAEEGRPLDAIQALSALVEENAHNAVDALTAMVRIALDEGIGIPERTVTDLRSAAIQHRRSPREAELRGLLAEALASRAQLAAAVEEVLRARADLPPAVPMFDELAVRFLAGADPVLVGASAYAEVMLEHAGLVGPKPGDDPARRTIAGHLLELGLANAALEMLSPATLRGDVQAGRLAARAHLRLGDGASALAAIEGQSGTEIAELRAQAFAIEGRFGEAAEALSAVGLEAEPYAWASGDWTRARDAAETAERVAMASYMAARDGEADAAVPAEDPAALPPDEAFQQPLPPLDRPSLSSARALLATSRQVSGFVTDVLEGE